MNALRIFLSLVDRPLPGVHQTAAPDVNRSVGRILSRTQDHSRGVQPARASPTLPPGMTVIPAKAGIHRDSGCARPTRSGLPDYVSAHELADRPPSWRPRPSDPNGEELLRGPRHAPCSCSARTSSIAYRNMPASTGFVSGSRGYERCVDVHLVGVHLTGGHDHFHSATRTREVRPPGKYSRLKRRVPRGAAAFGGRAETER